MLRKLAPFLLAVAVVATSLIALHRFVWLPHRCNVAKGVAKRRLEAAKKHPDAYHQRVAGLRNVEELEKFLAIQPRDAELSILMADSLMAAGRQQAARELYCGTLRFRRTAVIYLTCGNAQLLNGEKEDALRSFVLAGRFAGPRTLLAVTDPEVRWEAMRRVGEYHEQNLLARGELDQRNLVRNSSFSTEGPAGRRTDHTSEYSAALGWNLVAQGLVASTELVDSGGRQDRTALRVTVSQRRAGVRQRFPPSHVRPRVRTSAWVFVERGSVCMGASDGITFLTNTCSKTVGRWEKLEAVNESCPAGLVSLVAAGDGGATFLVDEVTSRETLAAPLCERW